MLLFSYQINLSESSRGCWLLLAISLLCIGLGQASAVDEIIVDNSDAVYTGYWTTAGSSTNKYLADYQFAITDTNTETASATFTPEIITPGKYDIYVWYPQTGTNDLAWTRAGKYEIYIWHPQDIDRLNDAPHLISFNGGTETVAINQTTNSGVWRLIASRKEFQTGNGGSVRISNLASAEKKVVVADAVRWVYSAAQVAPSITAQPESRTNTSGTTAIFSVSSSGSDPLIYQWKKGGLDLADSANVFGATSPSLTLMNVSENDVVDYSVVITNAAGSVTSLVATLTVVYPPLITVHPVGRTNNAGAGVEFSVVAVGTGPLGYQWRREGVDLGDGGNIFGANTATLTLAGVTGSDAGSYSVWVTNVAGAVLSSNAVLTVITNTDFDRPSVAVVRPLNNARTNVAVVTMSGTAKDKAPGRVVGVKYRLWPEVEYRSATLSSVGVQTNWVTESVELQPGTNVFHLFSVDSGGNTSLLKTNVVFYDSTNLLTVKIEGRGQVRTNTTGLVVSNQTIPLLVGRPFALTAFIGAGTNYVFTNWTGGTNGLVEVTNSLVYKFIMQSNLVLQANFITNPFTPVAGSYSGLFYETNEASGIRHESAGFFNLSLSGKADYSGNLYFDGDKISISGKFDLSGRSSKSFSRATKGKGNVNLFLELDWSTSSQQIHGTLSDGNWTSTLLGDRANFSLTNPETNFAGAYTFLTPRDLAGVAPVGFGYGLVTNNLLGQTTLSGGLGDGSLLSQKVSVSKDGEWPLYVQLYKTTNVVINPVTQLPVTNKLNYRGALLGWVTFTNQQPVGTLHWIKTGEAATNYFHPAGFTSVVDIIGSPYQAPGTGVRMLNLSSGTVTFADGNLSGPIAWGVTWANNNVITTSGAGTNRPTFTLTAKSGLVKGYFYNPQLGYAKTNFSGAVLQNQNYSGGFFPGTTQPGSFLLTP